jgi:hypothetical protein
MSEHRCYRLPDGTVLTDATQAPCGCVFGTIDHAFAFVPCSLLCELYLYFREQAKAQGKPLEVQIREGL